MTSLYSRTISVTRSVAQTLCGLILVRDYVAEAATCEGESMLPTLRAEGDVILVEKISVANRLLKHGDVIIAASPNNPDRLICKRIIGMEEDMVVNNTGPFISSQHIPRGHLWVEGDNAERSLDSRTFGPIPYGLVRGKVLCKLWPPSEFGNLIGPSIPQKWTLKTPKSHPLPRPKYILIMSDYSNAKKDTNHERPKRRFSNGFFKRLSFIASGRAAGSPEEENAMAGRVFEVISPGQQGGGRSPSDTQFRSIGTDGLQYNLLEVQRLSGVSSSLRPSSSATTPSPSVFDPSSILRLDPSSSALEKPRRRPRPKSMAGPILGDIRRASLTSETIAAANARRRSLTLGEVPDAFKSFQPLHVV